jgi:hypothetical protein
LPKKVIIKIEARFKVMEDLKKSTILKELKDETLPLNIEIYIDPWFEMDLDSVEIKDIKVK